MTGISGLGDQLQVVVGMNKNGPGTTVGKFFTIPLLAGANENTNALAIAAAINDSATGYGPGTASVAGGVVTIMSPVNHGVYLVNWDNTDLSNGSVTIDAATPLDGGYSSGPVPVSFTTGRINGWSEQTHSSGENYVSFNITDSALSGGFPAIANTILTSVDVTDPTQVASAFYIGLLNAYSSWAQKPSVTLSGADVIISFSGSADITLSNGSQNIFGISGDSPGTGFNISTPQGVNTVGNGVFAISAADVETFAAAPSTSSIVFGGKTVTEGTTNDSTVAIGKVSINASTGYTMTSTDAATNALFNTPAADNGSTDTSGGNNIEAQVLTINGSGTQTINVLQNEQANAIAAKVNGVTDGTQVQASASTAATLSNAIPGGPLAFKLNGVAVLAVVNGGDFRGLAEAINQQSNKTGVSATVAATGLVLKNSEGKDINIADFSAATQPSSISVKGGGTSIATRLTDTGVVPDTDLDSIVVGGQVEFKSTSSFSVQSSLDAASGGIFSGVANAPHTSTLQDVQSIDISTADGATRALDIVDGALADLNGIRSTLGATQNRFESTVRNLQVSTENLSASRSRIMDADYAVETAELTRNQILQQAGTAMLAQANSLPNNVLTLLKQN